LRAERDGPVFERGVAGLAGVAKCANRDGLVDESASGYAGGNGTIFLTSAA
jgi:hypothetical protein